MNVMTEDVPESIDNRNYRTRQATRLPSDSQKAILNDAKHGPLVGKAMDESFGGKGLLFQKSPTVRVGENVEYTHNGLVGSAIVRHITRGPKGYFVGLEWRGANYAQLARLAIAERHKNPPQGFTVSKERDSFIHTLPSSVHMIWSLCEAQNWAELSQYTSRLLDRAKSLGIVRLTEPAEDLRRKYQVTSPSEPEMMRAVALLLKTCIAVCRDGE